MGNTKKSFEPNGFIRGSDYWVNSADFPFSKIVKDSNIPPEWGDHNRVNELGYANKILKPINGYAHFFCNRPELEILSEGCIVLKQRTHAEIWVEKAANQIYMVDKCWQRQFYPDVVGLNLDLNNHFNAIFKFYMPWILDYNSKVKVISYEESPFTILTDYVHFDQLGQDVGIIDSPWIRFAIKDSSEYLMDDYGVIPIGTPMYGIMIYDKVIIERVLKQYEE